MEHINSDECKVTINRFYGNIFVTSFQQLVMNTATGKDIVILGEKEGGNKFKNINVSYAFTKNGTYKEKKDLKKLYDYMKEFCTK